MRLLAALDLVMCLTIVTNSLSFLILSAFGFMGHLSVVNESICGLLRFIDFASVLVPLFDSLSCFLQCPFSSSRLHSVY